MVTLVVVLPNGRVVFIVNHMVKQVKRVLSNASILVSSDREGEPALNVSIYIKDKQQLQVLQV